MYLCVFSSRIWLLKITLTLPRGAWSPGERLLLNQGGLSQRHFGKGAPWPGGRSVSQPLRDKEEHVPNSPFVLLPGICSREMKIRAYEDLCGNLHRTAANGTQPKHPQTSERTNQWWYILATEHHSAIQGHGLLIHATTWANLTIMTLSARSGKRRHALVDSIYTAASEKCRLGSSDTKLVSGSLGLKGEGTGGREEVGRSSGNSWGRLERSTRI